MKKKVIIFAILLIIVLLIGTIALYVFEATFRDWVDKNILKKDIKENDLPVISLSTDKQNQIHVYSKYIALLNNRVITLYNGFGEEAATIDVDINNALFASNNNYLTVAENGGNKICLILDKTYLWSGNVEGEIKQVFVNQNGYVCVITTDSTYKSILNVYNPSGKKLFRSYFASTRIVDVSISKDNKYIAIAELNTNSADIASYLKIISIENAQKDPENAIIFTHNADGGKLIVKTEYQDAGKILCMYDDSIDIIENENNKQLFSIKDKSISYLTVNLNNYFVYTEEEKVGLFKSRTKLKIVDINNDMEKEVLIEDIANLMYAKDNIIGLNFGNVLYFYDTNGWLIKKYTSNKEIIKFDFSSNIAAAIYKDKIIVINL